MRPPASSSTVPAGISFFAMATSSPGLSTMATSVIPCVAMNTSWAAPVCRRIYRPGAGFARISACPRPSGAGSHTGSDDKLRPPAGTPVWPMIDSDARQPGSHRVAAVPASVVELFHLLPLVLSPAAGSAALRAHARDSRGPDRVDHRILRGLLHGYQTAGRVGRRPAGTQTDPASGRHALPRLDAALPVEPDRGRAAWRPAPARGGHGLLPGRRRGDGRRSLAARPPGRSHGVLGRCRQ